WEEPAALAAVRLVRAAFTRTVPTLLAGLPQLLRSGPPDGHVAWRGPAEVHAEQGPTDKSPWARFSSAPFVLRPARGRGALASHGPGSRAPQKKAQSEEIRESFWSLPSGLAPPEGGGQRCSPPAPSAPVSRLEGRRPLLLLRGGLPAARGGKHALRIQQEHAVEVEEQHGDDRQEGQAEAEAPERAAHGVGQPVEEPAGEGEGR
uniref:Uncharacterized protein n=1 Tax=Varanus komodoensis TaxID=61221 RepID=A0A8D2JKM7_VARKO